MLLVPCRISPMGLEGMVLLSCIFGAGGIVCCVNSCLAPCAGDCKYFKCCPQGNPDHSSEAVLLIQQQQQLQLAAQTMRRIEVQQHFEQGQPIVDQPTDRTLMSPEPSKNQLFLDSRR